MNKDRQKKNKASLKQKVIVFLLGVVFTAIVLELGLRFAGQILLYLQDKKNQSSLSDPSAYRIICLGDSMTLNGGRYSYPRQLEDTLNNLKLGIKFRVINKGKIGLNSSGLMRGLGEDLRAYRPQMVIVMLGINDWYVKYYENIPDAKSFIFNNLKIFKLFRIFWTQMMDKKPVVKLAESLRTGRKGPVQEIISSNTEKKYFSLGYFFWSQGDLLEAQDAFKKAVELDPKNKKAYYELGRITRDLDMLEQSEAIFQKAIELDPKDIKSYLELGWACQLQDKLVQAEDLYKKAIKIAPEYFYSILDWGFFI